MGYPRRTSSTQADNTSTLTPIQGVRRIRLRVTPRNIATVYEGERLRVIRGVSSRQCEQRVGEPVDVVVRRVHIGGRARGRRHAEPLQER